MRVIKNVSDATIKSNSGKYIKTRFWIVSNYASLPALHCPSPRYSPSTFAWQQSPPSYPHSAILCSSWHSPSPTSKALRALQFGNAILNSVFERDQSIKTVLNATVWRQRKSDFSSSPFTELTNTIHSIKAALKRIE